MPAQTGTQQVRTTHLDRPSTGAWDCQGTPRRKEEPQTTALVIYEASTTDTAQPQRTAVAEALHGSGGRSAALPPPPDQWPIRPTRPIRPIRPIRLHPTHGQRCKGLLFRQVAGCGSTPHTQHAKGVAHHKLGPLDRPG